MTNTHTTHDAPCSDCGRTYFHTPDCSTRRRRSTRCEVVNLEAGAVSSYPDDMPADALRFEAQGWAMAFELAPRCDDIDCDICHG
jgi:hypothetical protein